jgi:anthranilate synthase component 2
MKKILIIDNYDSFTYNLAHYVEENPDFKVDVFRNDEISLAEVDKYDTIILSPGPGLPKDAGIMNELIKKYAKTKKILGVCLGMQAIGEVFGGELQNMKKVFHGVASPIKILDEKDALYQNLPKTFQIGRYHSWIVNKDKLPNELKITAITNQDEIMSISHKNYQVYGVQYHPESILTEYGKEIIQNFLKI